MVRQVEPERVPDRPAVEPLHSSLAFDVVPEPESGYGSGTFAAGAGRLALITTAALATALFLAAFFVTASGVRALVPWPSDMGMDVHLNVFEEHKDEYQAVYLGPSTVFRSFRPDVIDPVVSAAGKPFRSFSLGFGGMSGYEQNFYLRALVAMEPRALRWILAEPNAFVVDRTMFNLFSERELFWHDTESTAEVLRGIYRDSDSWPLRGRLWLAHLKVWSWRLVNLGMGPRIIEAMVRRKLETDALEEWSLLREGGYQNEYDIFANRHRQRAPDLTYPPIDPQQYVRDLKALEQRSQAPFDLERFDLPSFLEQRKVVEGSGRELYYVVPPLATPIPYVNALLEQKAIPWVLSFHGAERWPQLYLLQDRIDAAHLNRNGAGAFSAALAERLAGLWADRAEGPR